MSADDLLAALDEIGQRPSKQKPTRQSAYCFGGPLGGTYASHNGPEMLAVVPERRPLYAALMEPTDPTVPYIRTVLYRWRDMAMGEPPNPLLGSFAGSFVMRGAWVLDGYEHVVETQCRAVLALLSALGGSDAR